VGRDALLEMRRLLGALHPRAGGPQMAPQPSMADVPALLDRARAAGLPVELHEEGDRRELAPGLDLALYRVLQEALTNSLKHSGPAATDVRLSWTQESVELLVTDDGPPGNGYAEAQGLIGMRERVRLYGGELACSRRLEGGFRVHVRIPFTQEETV
jgi:signal transduction histidine kinase